MNRITKILTVAIAAMMAVAGGFNLLARQVSYEGVITGGNLPELTLQARQGKFNLDLDAPQIMKDTKKYSRVLGRNSQVRVEGQLVGDTIVVSTIYYGNRLREKLVLARENKKGDNFDKKDNRYEKDDNRHDKDDNRYEKDKKHKNKKNDNFKKDYRNFKNYGQYKKWLKEQRRKQDDSYDDQEDEYEYQKYNKYDDREKYDNHGKRLDYDRFDDMREFYKEKYKNFQLQKISAQFVKINWPIATVKTAQGNINVDIGPQDNFNGLGVSVGELIGKNAVFVYSKADKKIRIIRAIRFRNYTIQIVRGGNQYNELDELDAIDIIDNDQQYDSKLIIDFLKKKENRYEKDDDRYDKKHNDYEKDDNRYDKKHNDYEKDKKHYNKKNDNFKKDYRNFKNYGQYKKWLKEQRRKQDDSYDDQEDEYEYQKYNKYDDREKYDNNGKRLDYDRFDDMREFYKEKYKGAQLQKFKAQFVKINGPIATIKTAQGNINVDIGPENNFSNLGISINDLIGKNAMFVFSKVDKKIRIIRAIRFRNYTVSVNRGGNQFNELDELDAIDILDDDQQYDSKSIIDFLGKPNR